VHTNSSKAGILGRLAAWFCRAKIVHTVHGFGFHDRQNSLVQKFYILLERFFAKCTDELIFVSLMDLQTALSLKIAPVEKCKIIRAGVELKTKEDFKNFDKSAKLAELGLSTDSKIILCAANLKPQKNPLDMVRAAKIVRAKFPEAVFLYLGTGELQKQTQDLIDSYSLQNNFKLLGHRGDTPQLLAIADVFALSSLWEGLPMAVVEALSMQVPAVCYNAGGIGEVVKNGQDGYLVNRGDYEALAQYIIHVLEGGLTFNADAIDLKEFDIKEMLKKQQDLYTALMQWR